MDFQSTKRPIAMGNVDFKQNVRLQKLKFNNQDFIFRI